MEAYREILESYRDLFDSYKDETLNLVGHKTFTELKTLIEDGDLTSLEDKYVEAGSLGLKANIKEILDMLAAVKRSVEVRERSSYTDYAIHGSNRFLAMSVRQEEKLLRLEEQMEET